MIINHRPKGDIAIVVLTIVIIITEIIEAYIYLKQIGTHPWCENLIPLPLFLPGLGLAVVGDGKDLGMYSPLYVSSQT